jgi:RNA polymerase sigma-70 factor (ECF subfamily)
VDVLRTTGKTAEDDEESFAWFFTAEYPQVVRLLTVVVSDPAWAEDLAQEAFVRLHQRWSRVAEYESPEAWVRRVALNRAFSWRRREARRREVEGQAPPWATRPSMEAADSLVVLAAVRRLAPRDRALVALYHLEDRPMEDVAAVLGLSRNATKVALHRARRRLAALLNDPIDEEVAR